jgi:hypothetical protein
MTTIEILAIRMAKVINAGDASRQTVPMFGQDDGFKVLLRGMRRM